MKKLLQFFNEQQEEIGVSYLTFKKYMLNNIDSFKGVLKIVENKKRKSYYILDEEKFLKIFKA